MVLLRRQDFSQTFVDDQSPTLAQSYGGRWVRYNEATPRDYHLGTYTATSNPGDTFSFTFSGRRMWLVGGLNGSNISQDGHLVTHPTAEYFLDGVSVGVRAPFLNNNNGIIHFQTQNLEDGTHTVNVTVMTANSTNLFIVDYYGSNFITSGPNSGVHSSPTSRPTGPTSATLRAGTIAGGVVGSLAGITIIVVGLYYLLRLRGERGHPFEKPDPIEVIPNEYRAEPFNPTVAAHTPPATFGGPGSQPADSGGNPSPPFGQGGDGLLPFQDPEPGDMTRPWTGKTVLTAQPSGNIQQPVQNEDSGIRFNVRHEREHDPSQLSNKVPPTPSQFSDEFPPSYADV